MPTKKPPASNTLALDPLLPMPRVMELTTLSKASIYRKVGERSFPAPLKIGASRVAWKQSDVAGWIEAQTSTA